VARSRGVAAAACGAWVGYGFHPFRRAAQPAAGADRTIAAVCGGGRACGWGIERRFLAWAVRRLSRQSLGGLRIADLSLKDIANENELSC